MPGKSEGGRTAPRAPRAAAGADNCCSREAREGCMYKPRGGRLSSKLDAAAKKAQVRQAAECGSEIELLTYVNALQLRTWVQWRKQTACLAPPYKMILMVEYDVKEQAAEAVDAIFSSISAYDVRQQAGRTYDNAGEVLPSGVALLLATVGPLDEEDVFLDVGAGVGNILAHVALTTDARLCVGIEFRRVLVSLGQRCLHQQLKIQPRLDKVMLKLLDVRDVSMSRHSPICEATIVFANIFLFDEDAKLIVSRELSAMPVARVIVSTSLFCPRHRSSCSEPYCKSWKLDHQLEVQCSWKATPHAIYIYRKKL
ncbi:hypothetical protein L915_00653 [Phytophthora nicotianae]|uniref:Histone-lysine N-methyltransferase, H3 lysine-79 specific n=1 Tax=Phytophthora nicotianae TaxID=4792 RepID=W2HN66_PHYNI|nr:hypothetical protein L915_00653 [Phytophthora nicotianae]